MMVDDVVDVVVDVAVIPPDDGWFALGGWMDGGGSIIYLGGAPPWQKIYAMALL